MTDDGLSPLDQRTMQLADGAADTMRAFVESLPPATDANRREIERRVAALPPARRAEFERTVKTIAVEKFILQPENFDRFSPLEKRAWQLEHKARRGER